MLNITINCHWVKKDILNKTYHLLLTFYYFTPLYRRAVVFIWHKGKLELSREAGQFPWIREWEYAYSGVKVVLCMQDVSTEFINKAKQDKLLPDLHAILERLG